MGKKGQHKKAKHTKHPSTEKKASHTKEPEGFQHQLIAWHFHVMDSDGDWPCDIETITEISCRLHEYETKRWFEVEKIKNNHPMSTRSIEPKAQRRLVKLGLDDTGTLYQLYIAGKGKKRRLWGLRQENIFQILWWDPDHTVYIPNKFK